MTQKIPYTAPNWDGSAFNCVHCNAYANQLWEDLHRYDGGYYPQVKRAKICFCGHCGKYSIWHELKMIYPDFSGVESPNADLNIEIQTDYLEAASVVQRSPRGAVALLRLAIQKLVIQLGEKGDLNTAIGNLVKKGLPVKVQQSLDALRVIGNEAVHPGALDLKDDPETANSLFKLVNFIAEKMITEPKEIEAIYGKIPPSKQEQIEKRDGK
jgi:hypothetical protein